MVSGEPRIGPRVRGALIALTAALLLAARHPMHTAVVEITHDDASRSAALRIRVFADDFGAAVRASPGTGAADSAMARYVRGTVSLIDRSGQPASLRWESAERMGDVILLRLSAPAPEGLSGGRVHSTLLCERFEDQVNIVRVLSGGRTTTLLFTRGDQPKALP
jgi:hypothetical protein